ncbi:phosphoribosyltransferase [Edaphobacter acidisoli]|uniref:Phosphoribosyltransferase n=1 Tax=Edaphobacter acidisoli TaxID=2040573 RepID=A0A916RS31_9BACT|nr:phosphoribosyltransferase family protein [Edaphobacter acidisoli]GGA66953.1 phosphoribosyltransferase [Edaphobacter acidisoli]
MFRDRRHAGERLARLLESHHGQPQTIVLALPRGGVPVAAAAARELQLPLDILPAHKLGAPSQPEFAIGAIAGDGVLVLNDRAIAHMNISEDTLNEAIAREREELHRRERLYRDNRPPLSLAEWTTILVDDGLATGYTMLAAIRAIREQKPAKIVVAVPVAPPSTLDRMAEEADEIVCVHSAEDLFAVGQFYSDFSQISDEEVQTIMRAD